ncbi:protein TASOR 2 [Numenius arquata]|uniref:protein TASOR 2 n=1 Tax=Numenius arquata TaxID=31919 RepID=UPI003D30A225
MGERRDEETGGPGTGFHPESEESSSLLQTAVSVLRSSYLDSTSQDGFQYSQAILVENDVFLSELKAFAQAKEAAGYSQEELEETFAFLLFDNEEEAKEVCQRGLRVNSSSISTLGDPAKGVYISKYADCLHPRPWYHGKSGYIVICKLIKYYVYEVSDGSAAERPRQICPYIIIACQYREPKEMPVLALESLPELNHKALYCPWRGQLSIRGQLLCNIALRTPYSSTIPAQLPPNLDINHVMGLSDLKKKLPEAAFGKGNYVENEVCFQGVYFSLYEVEISNKDQYKMDQLIENLKEKDLAIIKYLQDQGVLILLTSSALARDDGFDPKEPVSLLALFLFTSSRSVSLRVEKHDPKDEREDSDDSDISLKIASVLPGLRYALQKATSSSWGDTVSTSTCIKQHLQEYSKLDQNPQPASCQTSKVPFSSLLSPTEDECTSPFKKLSEQSFSQLQSYFSDPSSYTLEMSSALGCLTGAVQSLRCNSEAHCKEDVSSAVTPDPVPPNTVAERKLRRENSKPAVGLDQGGDGPTKDVNLASKLWVQQSRRKSSRAVVTSARKKWSPLKKQMHPVGDSGRNRKATKKKKISITFSFPKKPGLTASSNEPMLKLANLQFPHRRKRGAEVLSAEFVHKTQAEPVQKETSAPDSPGLETKRAKTVKKPDVKKVSVAETVTKPVKSKMLKSVADSPSNPQAKKQAESEWKEPFSVLPSNVSSQSHRASSQTSDIYPGGVADLGFDLKGNNYESHALNLLADLALGSCIPSFIPRDGRIIPVSCSPTSDSAKEQQSHRKHKSSRVASDHEYHRVDKVTKGTTSPSKASLNQKLPPAAKIDLNDLASIPREKSPGIFSKKNSASPSPAKPQAVPPREAQEAVEVNKHSFISAEHSYASQMPEHSKKHVYPRGSPYPGPAPSRNGTRNPRTGPLIGKVLPFRHQQNSTHPQRPFEAVAMRRRSSLLSPRLKENFAKSHTVNICGESVKVTCHWEAEYLFNLDSRYTNDALEKTVIRALHGPWDPDLPDDVEEMKLILHMWVALFYSKPSKLLSSTRKVVEHSNPEKFVSLNSTGDFLELSDDGEDCFGLETCPADSHSDPDQTPSSSLDRSTRCQGSFHPEKSPADSQTDAAGTPGVVDSIVSSSSGELPCEEEEPSSTSCPESLSLAERADVSLAVKDRQLVVLPEERVHDVSTITAEEPPKEGASDATIAPSPSDELRDAEEPSPALSRENLCSQALNSSAAPWSDAPSALRGRGEQQESGWASGSAGVPDPPEDRASLGDAGHSTEVEDSSWAASNGPQRACDLMPLEACPKSAKPTGASGEGKESQDPFGHPEKEEKEGLPGEMAPSLDTLQEPCEALATPDAETNGVGLAQAASPAHVGSPCDSRLMPPSPSDPSLVHGTQPDSVTGNLGPAGEMLGDSLEQKDKDCVPSAESSVCMAPLDGATDPGAAPEDQEAMASIQSPLQSDLGGSSCLSQRCGGDVCADLASLRAGESNQEENKVLVEEQRSSPSANHTDVSWGADDSQGFAFDCTALAGGSEAGESDGVFLSAEKSPRSDKTNTAMVINAPEEPEPSLHHLLRSEASSSVGEGMSAMKEHPKQQQSSPDGLSPPARTDLAPASPPKQDSLPCGGDTDTPHRLLEQSERGPVPCQNGKPSEQVGAAEVAAKSPDGSLKPRCAEEVTKDTGPCYAEPAESSPRDVLVPGSPSLTPPSPPHNHKAGLHGIEPDSALSAHPESLAPDGSPTSCYTGQLPLGPCSRCASPGDMGGSHEEEPIPHEDSEGGSSVPLASPASFLAGESLTPLCKPPSAREREAEGSDTFANVHHAGVEVGEGEIPTLPFPMLPLCARRGILGEGLELGDTEDISDALPRSKQLRRRERHMDSTSEGLFEFFSGDSDQEYFGGSVDAADTRTNCDSSSPSSVHTEGRSEDWGSLGLEGDSWAERGWSISPGQASSGYVPPYINIRDRQGIAKDYRNFVVTKKCPERMGNLQPWKRRSHRAGQSHLLRSLMGTWRGFEEITQRTLDMECLRFHYKLKQILRNRKPPFSTSKSIFPKDFAPREREAPVPLSPRSRSPLQVTLLPSDTWPSGLGWHRPRGWRGDPCAPWRDNLCDSRSRARSRTGSRGHAAPFHLNKLRYDNKLKDSRGDIAVILDEYAELNRVRLSRADTGSGDRGTVPAPGEARSEWTCVSLPVRMTAFEEMIADLCSTLRFRLRSVAEEACGRTGMFYLVETGQDPFFARVKALLKKDGRVEVEPLSFCEAKHPDADRLLVVIRNEDISLHIHNVPCLLKLKRCSNVVFAGVDGPEDITAHTYQELFHTGGFVVSDDEVLETVTLGQLKEVVKVLEKLNRSGRWKWLLHYKESKKLREDIRVDSNARKKHSILKSCQGADLVEVLHYHACDAASSPTSHSVNCLLNLQVQRVSARFAVYLTEKPNLSREVLESKGILVVDVNTFLGTVQKVAAPFRRSYW